MAVFVYLAPCLTALGLHWVVPSEHLSVLQWLGVLLAFAGIATAFADGFVADRASLLGEPAHAPVKSSANQPQIGEWRQSVRWRVFCSRSGKSPLEAAL